MKVLFLEIWEPQHWACANNRASLIIGVELAQVRSKEIDDHFTLQEAENHVQRLLYNILTSLYEK